MKIHLKSDALNRIFAACKHAMSNDPHRAGIWLRCENGSCCAVAVDGHRARTITVECTGDDGTICVPWLRLPKSKQPFNVTIEESEEVLAFTYQNTKLAFDKFKSCFFSVDKILPTESPVLTIEFNPLYLKEAFESFADKTVEIRFYGPSRPCVISAGSDLEIVMPRISKK